MLAPQFDSSIGQSIVTLHGQLRCYFRILFYEELLRYCRDEHFIDVQASSFKLCFIISLFGRLKSLYLESLKMLKSNSSNRTSRFLNF